ncbi:ATP-binding cassette domain-containing protein [Lysinibacillus sp. NPDC094177]|uniref:ABC transporter ATP-binding protein n=1 Tax=Lysinibacillus sp. NPDC094177 TaxID=3390580 RepID=UPI003D091D4A
MSKLAVTFQKIVSKGIFVLVDKCEVIIGGALFDVSLSWKILNDILIISDSASNIARYCDLNISKSAVALNLISSLPYYPFQNIPLWEGVNKIQPFCVLKYGKNKQLDEFKIWMPLELSNDLELTLQNIRERFFELLRNPTNSYANLSADLSGGVDSAAIAYALKAYYADIKLYHAKTDSKWNSDSKWATMIAEMVLKEVTLSAEYGKRTAIVGPSGAGKSTVLQLIERFYDPISGQIYVDGKDYRSYSREELRKLITYVEQNAPIIAGTLRDNLLLGNSNVSDQECYDVLKEVNLSYLIERSSEKLDMKIGESGTTLSGGERQRLAMARSLLSKAEIVLLDELTSNLDSLNEIGMKKAVDKMRESKTVIVVAHRLSTIVDSDIIYVLEHGRIVGSGNHNELLDKVPLYRELAKEQFLDKAI